MTGFVTKKLGRSRSLASILKAARTKAGVSLEEAEVQTKVRLKYLEALETGQYHLLPAEAYNIGFIRAYAEYLKLNPDKIVRLYREERSQRVFQPRAEKQVALAPQRTVDWHFLITPKVLGVLGAILLFGGVISYIAFQLNEFTKPPAVSINNVPSEFTSDKDRVKLEGKATAGSVVFMNAEPISVDPIGSFAQEIQLSPGVNEVIVSAKSRAGKESRLSVRILFNPNIAKAN